MAEENSPKPQRIGLGKAVLMLGLTLIFDLLSIVPFVSILVALIHWLIFFFWFYLSGVNMMKTGRLVAVISSAIIEFIPVLNWLPGLTVGILSIIIMVRLEDKIPALKKLAGAKK